MPLSTSHHWDVIVAGAGPVGLFLACELRLGGCSVLVLEKARFPDTPLKQLPFGLRGLTEPSLETFDRRDLLDAIETRALARPDTTAQGLGEARQPGGHFAGIQFFVDQVRREAWPHRLDAPAATTAVDMAGIEAVLADTGRSARRGDPARAGHRWSRADRWRRDRRGRWPEPPVRLARRLRRRPQHRP